MLIDLILDRQIGYNYSPKEFYNYLITNPLYNQNELGQAITRALDEGTEQEVKTLLKQYLTDTGCQGKVFSYIDSVNWLTGQRARQLQAFLLTRELNLDEEDFEFDDEDVIISNEDLTIEILNCKEYKEDMEIEKMLWKITSIYDMDGLAQCQRICKEINNFNNK